MRALLALAGLLSASAAGAQTTAAALARQIRNAGLDAEECYRVHELNFQKEDIRIYLTDGYLVFGKPVNGMRLAATFVADVEGGDAEVLVFPPISSERRSLASYTESPNLNEHFKTALMLFTDDTGAALMRRIRESGDARKSLEEGLLVAGAWSGTLKNLAASFEIRLVADLLAGSPGGGLFYAAVTGNKLGNFDIIYDPRARQQVTIGQVNAQGQSVFFDFWTSFEARSYRTGAREAPGADLTLRNVRLEATLEPNLNLCAVTRARLTPTPLSRRVLSFDISRRMRVTEARIDGEPAEVLQRESLRANLIRGSDNEVFLVVPGRELEPGREYEIEFRHEGEVISEAGNRVYFVGARGSWYPNRAMQFAEYDLAFRYPRNFGLVATGEVVEDRTEGEWRVTRRRTSSPVRLAGFNLGDYQRAVVNRGGYTVEVYANRNVEAALAPRAPQVVVLPPFPAITRGTHRTDPVVTVPPGPAVVDPTARLQSLAVEIAAALEFMASAFGPPPLKTLTVSPIPGTFGQGFPGLLYLSTVTYLAHGERPASARGVQSRLFFSEILHAHETAHQWWGNTVTAAGHQDEWLMESLANYSALLVVERRKGARTVESVLEEYKNRLMQPAADGRPIEATGPIVLGARLKTSLAPGAWRSITYEKGSWIMHMLRRRLGDQRFLAMLKELCRRYKYRGVSTEQFRKLVQEYLPPKSTDPTLEEFFARWVYDTGIPTLKLDWSVRGKAPQVRLKGTLTQSGVDAEVSVEVPVEIQLPRGRTITRLVRTAATPAAFEAMLPQPPVKVLLDPGLSVLAVRK